MNKSEVRMRIEEFGIVPSVRVSNSDYARFATEAVYYSGIPIAEITLTTPKAIELISEISNKLPDMVIGAGTVLDRQSASRCIDAGAKFLTSPGLVKEVVEFAVQNDVVVFPGALTPTEVIAAWKAGSDFVKIFPCGPVGGHHYLRSLKVPLPPEKLLTYALGRGLEYYDEPSVRAIEREAAENGNRLPALLTAIVKSAPFRMRTAPERAAPK
jgi:2-dehydro-3-deoxyphosphogluconate aldolase/(4S)-4-hydroxy-2-oxoglutarate aldolase